MPHPDHFTPGKENWYPFQHDKLYRNPLKAKNKIIVLVLFEPVVVKWLEKFPFKCMKFPFDDQALSNI